MPTSDDSIAYAEVAQQAMRALAHATQSIGDPTAVHTLLGSLAATAASLEQTLHHVARAHDGATVGRAKVDGDAREGRSASYRVSMDLHRAAEMLHQIRAGIDRAHQVEATIAYDHRPAASADRPMAAPPAGMSL